MQQTSSRPEAETPQAVATQINERKMEDDDCIDEHTKRLVGVLDLQVREVIECNPVRQGAVEGTATKQLLDSLIGEKLTSGVDAHRLVLSQQAHSETQSSPEFAEDGLGQDTKVHAQTHPP
eukprot:3552048-Prymnesium_polylepis.1